MDHKPEKDLLRTEIKIVWGRLFPDKYFKSAQGIRKEAWDKHIEVYLKMTQSPADAKPDPEQQAAAITQTKVAYLGRHLDVVDDKVGRLLQFQALVIVAIAAGAGTIWHNYYSQIWQLHPVAVYIPIRMFWLAFTLWFLATLNSFWAIRRVAWGDFEKYESDIPRAREEYIGFLTEEVIKRTAKYRVAVPLTVISLVLLTACLPLVFCLNRGSKAVEVKPAGSRTSVPSVVPVGEIGPRVGPFQLGIGCPSKGELQGMLMAVADIIHTKGVGRVQIVGSADAVPIGSSLAKLYGNNVGLALERARCVERWLAQWPATRDVHVEIAVRDAVGRTPQNRLHGNIEDRKVTIEALRDTKSQGCSPFTIHDPSP